MKSSQSFILLDLTPGLLYEHSEANHKLELVGFCDSKDISLAENFTHFGVVVEGSVDILTTERMWTLYAGDYFSLVGKATIHGGGKGLVHSFSNYKGVNLIGGPIEEIGRLKYIDGCTDSLLIPPIKMGDPCLNHLHFPKNITQTPHTHPSIRAGIIYRGGGECVLPDKKIPLKPFNVWLIESNTVHSFNTDQDIMDVIAFHPDSDYGPQDENHPMINRTIVDGKSASENEDIRTK
jgi:hypothetical protein